MYISCMWRGYCLNNMGNTHGQLNRHFPTGENSGNKEGCKKRSTGRFGRSCLLICIMYFPFFQKGMDFSKTPDFTVCVFFSFLSLVFVFLFQGGSDEYHCEGLERMNSDIGVYSVHLRQKETQNGLDFHMQAHPDLSSTFDGNSLVMPRALCSFWQFEDVQRSCMTSTATH